MPKRPMLALDSTVVVRYGGKQAGAEIGYDPKEPGRPSHHPLLAFPVETRDLIGLLWRPGSAWSGARAEEWIPELVHWLREVGVREITVRLDKGFWRKEIVRAPQELVVRFLMKAPNQDDVPKNVPDIHALTAWRRCNVGYVIEQRIEELAQLSVGQTAIDDLDGNRLLWDLGGLAYQLFHELRCRLRGAWAGAQPKRVRAWLFRTCGRWTTHGERWRLDPSPVELSERLFGRELSALRGPPRYAR